MFLLLASSVLSLANDGARYENVTNPEVPKDLAKEARMMDALAYLHSIGVEPHELTQYYEATTLDIPNRRMEEESESPENDLVFYVTNGSLAFMCVCVAALAAGLTMGLVSQEILDLKIKEVASESEEERRQARSLVPLLRDHHRLLVTLLLINALANEALPLFLDELVPSK